MDTLQLERLPGGGEHVAVAAGVDDDLGRDGLLAGLVLDNHRPDGALFHHRLAGPGVVENTDAGLLQHLVGGEDELVWLEGHGVAYTVGAAAPDQPPAGVALHQPGVRVVPLLPGRVVNGAAPLHPVHDLLAEAGHGLAASAVVHGEEQDDEAAAGQAAQVSEALHQHDLGAVAGGRGGRGQSGGAPSHHQHVGLGRDGQAGPRQENVTPRDLRQGRAPAFGGAWRWP